jgi:ATP-dependent Clp endopeptidase proteolytic subunit ClpP
MEKPQLDTLQYFQNASGDTATMRIYKPIGGDGGIQGDVFAQELDYLASFYKKINIRVNCPGGSILQGYAIFSSILNCKVPVHTYNDGIAASMGGVILMAGKKVFMADYAKLMLHNPHNGNPNPSAQEQSVLSSLKDGLVKIFETRTSQNKEAIDEMMNVETWLSAEEALSKGFIDEVISYPNKRGQVSPEGNNTPTALYEFYNSILSEPAPITKPTHTMNDSKVFDNLKNALGLSLDSSEKETIAEIKNLKAKGMQNDMLLEEINSLKAENEELKAMNEEAKKANAVALIEDALAKGKIRANQKDSFMKLALTDFDLAKDTINNLSASTHPRFSERTTTVDEKAGWGLLDYMKNDPTELERIKNEEPGLYVKLYKAQYGFVPQS